MSLSKLFPLDDQFVPRSLIIPPLQDEPAVADEPEQQPPITTQAPEVADEAGSVLAESDAFRRGLAEGASQSQEELAKALQAFRDATSRLTEFRTALYEQGRQEIIGLVMAICRKLLHRELAVDPTIIGDTLREAILLALQADEFHVHLHPEDLAEADRLRPSLMQSVRGLQHLVLHPDTRISRGGCRVESSLGDVDATIEGQLASIETALRGRALPDGTQKKEEGGQ